MTETANSTCPRCGKRFSCMAGTGKACPCAGVALTDAQRAEIAGQWEGCLCVECLGAIKAMGNPAVRAGAET